MKNKNLIIALIVVAAIVILGVAYAAINNITLNINGTAAAIPSDANFKVKFTGTPTKGAHVTEATITDDKNATMTVSGLTAKGDSATATFTVTNASPDLSAKIAVAAASITDTEYFKVTATPSTTAAITTGKTATVTVKVELIKTPISTSPSGKITVSLTASPVQP